MKITGGKYKGRKIESSKDPNVRPTMSRAREAFFNMIMHSDLFLNRIENLKFLDLFCGTGIMGIEAISRGIKDVTMIDIDTTTARQNTQILQIEDSVSILDRDITKMQQAPGKFDLIFMDPPYNNDSVTEKTLENIVSQNWINDQCLVVLETKQDIFKFKIDSKLQLINHRKYGTCRIFMLRFCQSKLYAC